MNDSTEPHRRNRSSDRDEGQKSTRKRGTA